MGIVSLKQSMELFWLGRYVERVYLTLRHLDQLYDVLLDIDKEAYKKFCAELEIPDIYEDRLDFVNNYLFSKENPDSIYSNLSRAYDNGIVLRNCISSASLSYIQMALDVLESGKKLQANALLDQQVIDYLLAFWGCIDDFVKSHQQRNMIKAGRYLERLDMQLRFREPWSDIQITIRKLERRFEGAGLRWDEDKIRTMLNYARLTPKDDESYRAVLKIADSLTV